MIPPGRYTCFLLLALLALGATGAVAQTSASSLPPIQEMSVSEGLTVAAVVVEGLTVMEEEEFLYLLDWPPGSPVTGNRIRAGIARAFHSAKFLDIRAYLEHVIENQNAAVIRVRVVERLRVSSVSVSGRYPCSKKDVIKATGLVVGGEYREDRREAIIGNVRQLMTVLGYPEAAVDLEVEDGKPHAPFVEVRIRVDEGEPLIIREVSVEGGGVPAEVASALDVGPGRIFSEKDLAERADGYVRKLRGKGHFQAVKPTWTMQDGGLVIHFNPGPRFEVRFEGNQAVSSRTMRNLVRFEDQESPLTSELIEDAARRYIAHYRQIGYPFAQVASAVNTEGDRTVLSFTFHEGQKIRLRSIEFEGVTLEDVQRLKDVLGVKEGKDLDLQSLEENMTGLLTLYRSLGFMEVKHEKTLTSYDLEKGEVTVTVVVEEGPRTLVRNLRFIGNSNLSSTDLASVAKLAEGAPFNSVDLTDARQRILDAYRRQGYMAATVSFAPELSEDRTWVDLTFEIQEGGRFAFGKTIVSGNVRTQSELIRKHMRLNEGTVYDEQKLLVDRRKLNRTGLFSRIAVTSVPNQVYPEQRDVVVQVTEDAFGSVDLGVGYGDYDHARGFVEIGHSNLGGWNRWVSLRGEWSGLVRRYTLSYRDPWIFGDYDLPLRAALIREYNKALDPDSGDTRFESDRRSVTVGVDKEFSPTLKGALNYEYSQVETYNVRAGEILSPQDEGTLGISSIIPSLARDTRSNPFNPKSGSLNTIMIKLAPSWLLSETEFIKTTILSNWYVHLTGPLVGAFSVKAGLARSLGKHADLPLVERFFLGGGNSVRGFARDSLGPKADDGTPTGGNTFLQINTELRMDVWGGLGAVAFIDGGNVWPRNADIDPTDLRFSWGGGLRYETPVGPFRLDYGIKFNPEKDESSSEVHFSLGHAF